MHVHAAHANGAAARLDAQHVAGRDASRPERSGGDRADALQREHAVDIQARCTLGVSFRRGHARKGGAQLVEPGAGLRRDGDHFGARDELARLVDRERERLCVDRIGFRDRDDTLVDAEQPQDGEMLVRLRARALLRVDHEQEEVDAGGSGDHRAHEPLVAGHVDEREASPVRQLERGVAQVDRDSARLLFGQPVGVLARERAHEPRLAVVDVAGRADRQRHARTAAATSSSSPSASVRQSSSRRPSRTIPITGGSLVAQRGRERLLDRAGERRQLGERQRAAADAADRLLDLAADARREALGARADGSRRPRAASAAPAPRAARVPARDRAAAFPRAPRGRACRCAARGAADGAAAARRDRRVRRRCPPAARRAACRR